MRRDWYPRCNISNFNYTSYIFFCKFNIFILLRCEKGKWTRLINSARFFRYTFLFISFLEEKFVKKKKKISASLHSYFRISYRYPSAWKIRPLCANFYHRQYLSLFLANNSSSIVTKWPHSIHRRRMLVKTILKRNMFSRKIRGRNLLTRHDTWFLKKKNLYIALLCSQTHRANLKAERFIRNLHYISTRAAPQPFTLCTNRII